MLKRWKTISNSNKGSLTMQRAQLHLYRSRLRLDKLIWKRSRIWRDVSTKKWSNTANKSRKWRMKWQTSSQRQISSRPLSRKRRQGLSSFRNLWSSTNTVSLSNPLTMQCAMILKRIWFFKMRSTTSSMKLKRSSSSTSPRYMPYSSILRLRELSLIIRLSSRSVSNWERT